MSKAILTEFELNAGLQSLPKEQIQELLFEVIEKNNLQAVKAIIKAVPSAAYAVNVRGETPMYWAAENGYPEVVKLLKAVPAAPTRPPVTLEQLRAALGL